MAVLASPSAGARALLLAFAASGFVAAASAQAPAPAPAPAPTAATPPATPGSSLASLGWLEGCWRGNVNQREFREHWMPLRGGMLIGSSQTVTQGGTQDFEFLRIESRPDGVYYVAIPGGRNETAFKLTDSTIDKTENRNDEVFTFTGAAGAFPERIIYRRASAGWLYANVEGKVDGADRKVIFPMRRIDCETGELIEK